MNLYFVYKSFLNSKTPEQLEKNISKQLLKYQLFLKWSYSTNWEDFKYSTKALYVCGSYQTFFLTILSLCMYDIWDLFLEINPDLWDINLWDIESNLEKKKNLHYKKSITHNCEKQKADLWDKESQLSFFTIWFIAWWKPKTKLQYVNSEFWEKKPQNCVM